MYDERIVGYGGTEELETLEKKMGLWLKCKSELLSSLIEGKKILEVGCGIGSLTHFISRGKNDVVAIDLSPVCLDRAKRKGIDATFLLADICNAHALHGYHDFFDSVVMSDVLEHIEIQDRALKVVFSLLRKNGVLILTVPAFQTLYSELDRKIGHYRRYQKREIVEILRNVKFSVELCRYWNVLGLFGWFIVQKIQKKTDLYTGSPSLMRLYHKCLSLEARAIFPFGLTLVVKARKPP